MCVRLLTPNALCLQSVSHCHRELVKSYSCPGSVSARPEEKLMARIGVLCGPGRWVWVGECGCGDPRGMVLSQDFSLSWVEKEFPSNGLAKNVDVTGKGNKV